MKVRITDTTEADRLSAQVFFQAVTSYYDLTIGVALDAFARNGQLTVANYYDKVGVIDAWELGAEHAKALEQFNCRNIKIGCSYVTAKVSGSKAYDLVVVDTPQGLHKDACGSTCAEHFDFLPLLEGLLKPERALTVLYCNKKPYDRDAVGNHGYDDYAEYSFEDWMRRREQFYGTSTPQDVTEAEMLQAYEHAFAKIGRKIVSTVMVPCFSDVPGKEPYAFRLAIESIAI